MDSLSVSIFQPVARDDPPAAKLNWLDMAANRASNAGSQLLICAELSLTGYNIGERMHERAQPVLGEYAVRVGEIAALHEIAIVYGYPESDNGALYNAAAFVTPDGRMLAHHRKNHIPPGFETDLFTAGDQLRVFNYAGWRIGILICYDIEFPEAARQAALQGAEFLIVPTALGAQWSFVADKMVPTRAWENGVFLAYANWAGSEDGITYLGGSRIIGPDGHIDAVAGGGEEVITFAIEKNRVQSAQERLPYLTDRRKYNL